MGSDYGVFAIPLGKKFSAALGGGYFSSGDIDNMDATGVQLGSYKYWSYAAGGALAWRGDKLAVGGKLKHVKESMAGYSAGALAGDFGALYFLGPATLAAALRDFGGNMTLYEQASRFSGTLVGGASIRLMDKNLLISGEADKPLASGTITRYCAGGELRSSGGGDFGIFYLRGGWQFNRDINTGNGLTTGIGITVDNKYTVDYAYVPMGDFGVAHRLSLKIDFGEGNASAKAAAKPAKQRIEQAQPGQYNSVHDAVEDYRAGHLTLDELRAAIRKIGFNQP
jgi:hypothetical protein